METNIKEREKTESRRGRSRIKSIFILAGFAVAVLTGLVGWQLSGRTEETSYSRAVVQRGDLVKTISATGKLKAVVTVQVGSQVSGRIAEVHVDFNSQVKKGQIIAKLDPSLLEAQLQQAQANLAAANAKLETAETTVTNVQAGISSAEANRERMQVAQLDAKHAYDRLNELLRTGVVSTREVESAEATAAQAEAQLRQAAAQVDQAKAELLAVRSQVNEARAQVRQTQASVDLATANLGYSIIRAPIDGIVIERSVDVGQTVAASLQAPILFVIANDLTQMRVLADIDEADVGEINQGSRVTFSVDAFPGDLFEGTVWQVRLNPQTVQNVVTYTAVIDVSNPALKLKPGMTANITAVVAERQKALSIPNAALRFWPASVEKKSVGSAAQTVWRIDGTGALVHIPVKLGINDGARTEIVSGDLTAGDEVITGEGAASVAQASAASRSPMMPLGGPGGRP